MPVNPFDGNANFGNPEKYGNKGIIEGKVGWDRLLRDKKGWTKQSLRNTRGFAKVGKIGH
jgi:hypothetical protein